MGTAIIIVILAVIVVMALLSSRRHFKGEGGCCGGGELKSGRKRLDAPKIAEKRVLIEGMSCDGCKNSVEKALNKIDGAAATVKLKQNMAYVSVSREISDEEIEAAVKGAGFRAVKIETEAV